MGVSPPLVRTLLCGCLLLGTAGLGSAERALAATPGRVRLVWFDPMGRLPLAFPSEAIGHELQMVLSNSGLDLAVEWVISRPGEVTAGSDFRVILLPEDPAPSRRGRNVVGCVMRATQPGQRSIWIVLENLERTLRLEPADRERHERVLARAIGRIVAHEMVHAVAPWFPHTHGGLMRERLGRDELAGPVARLGRASGDALMKGLASFRGEAAPATGRPMRKPAALARGLDRPGAAGEAGSR